MADPRANPAKVQLDAPGTEAGAMERLFLLEATTPGQRSYVASENLRAMRLMRQVIENRLKSPTEYGARGARSDTDIIEMGNLFAGFGGYPALGGDMTYNLALFLRIANSANDRRQATYAQYVQDAITAATESIIPPTAAYADVTAWRTTTTASPGARFRFLTTLSGNDFYATNPVPPMPPRHVKHTHRRLAGAHPRQ